MNLLPTRAQVYSQSLKGFDVLLCPALLLIHGDLFAILRIDLSLYQGRYRSLCRFRLALKQFWYAKTLFRRSREIEKREVETLMRHSLIILDISELVD